MTTEQTELAQLKPLLAKGMGITHMAEQIGQSPRHVRLLLVRAGLWSQGEGRRGPRHGYKVAQIEAAHGASIKQILQSFADARMTQGQAGEKLGLSRTHVRWLSEEHEVTGFHRSNRRGVRLGPRNEVNAEKSRKAACKLLTLGDQTRSIQDWLAHLGLTRAAFAHRRQHWPVENILSGKPPRSTT